ncbi:hypothetical protein HDU84_004332 [Entophlyctis sp. JEL0112]|nr:hypothetical protein HDU84_004332 [Entophlyctis sp. JEL0112]
MFSEDVTTNRTDIPSAPPKRKAGRKPGPVPETERQRRNMEVQRAFRERQRTKIETLQSRIRELEFALADKVQQSRHHFPETGSVIEVVRVAEQAVLRSSGVKIDFSPALLDPISGCTHCAAEKARTLVALGQVARSEANVANLEAQIRALKTYTAIPVSSNYNVEVDTTARFVERNELPLTNSIPTCFETTYCSDSVKMNAMSVAKYDVGIMAVDYARISLKSIPSLTMRTSLEKEYFLDCRMRFLALRGKIIDMCTIFERKQVIEIIGWMMYFNSVRLRTIVKDFLIEVEKNSEEEAVRVMARKMKQLDNQHNGKVMAARSAFLRCPSLKDKALIADEFLYAVWTNLVDGESTDKYKFNLKTMRIFYEMKVMDDYIHLGIALEMIRQANRRAFDEVYAVV